MQLNEIMLRFGAFGLIGAHYKEMAIVTDPFTNQQTEQIGQPQPIFDLGPVHGPGADAGRRAQHVPAGGSRREIRGCRAADWRAAVVAVRCRGVARDSGAVAAATGRLVRAGGATGQRAGTVHRTAARLSGLFYDHADHI